MSNLLDPDFYNNIPVWIYAVSGVGVFVTINTSILWCYLCKYKNSISKIEMKQLEIDKRELELERKEFELNKRLKREKMEKAEKKDYNGIVLTKPTLYSEFV